MLAQDLTLAKYFLAVHSLISRGVNVSLDQIDAFIDEGFPNEADQEGYLNYIHCLTLMLDSHHKTEDDIAFPYFREALPDTHFNWLFEDHTLITGFLEELIPIIETLEKGENVRDDLILLKEVLLKIDDRWSQHIELEEEEFINLIDALSTDEEISQLFTRLGEFNQELINPQYLTLPFMLFNLESQDRVVIMNVYPEEWFIHIDKPEWKENWESMIPYFLSE